MRSVVVAIAVIIVLPAAPAAANDAGDPTETYAETYAMVFPVDGENTYSDTWGAPRSGGRTHEGTDIMADKMVPVVAVASGTIGWMHDTIGGKCCAMALKHDDGWESYYIHLNNDTPGTDDGLGWGFAPGIEKGVHVDAGQLIGYVGDSGNAEWASPHLHYELHRPDGVKVNPYPHLIEAIQPGAGIDFGADPTCPPDAACDSIALVDFGAKFHLLDELRWKADMAAFYYGNPDDFPLMGDWDCDGVATPAMYRSSNGFMYLRNSNSQGVANMDYFYGDPSDIPLAGDFNGDGCDTLAIYRPAEGKAYIKNSLGTGVADSEFFFGDPGDKPFAGDFDGDGIDTIGLHREDTGFVYFRNSNESGVADFEFFYGDPGDKVLAGDWDGDGDDTVAVFRPSTGMLYVKFENSDGVADHTVPVGSGWSTALVGSGHHKASTPAEDEPPGENKAPVEEEPPGEDKAPVEEEPPGEDKAPVEEEPPGEDKAPVEEEPPGEEEPSDWPTSVERWRPLVADHFPPEMVEDALMVVSCESNGDPSQTNPVSGAAGLFQLIPSTWDWVASELDIADYDSEAPYDPVLNIMAADWLVQYSIDHGHPAWKHWVCQP